MITGIDPAHYNREAIKYLTWDNPADPRFRTFDDFLRWGKSIGMDFAECREVFDFIKGGLNETVFCPGSHPVAVL
jgi:hypothetical protein